MKLKINGVLYNDPSTTAQSVSTIPQDLVGVAVQKTVEVLLHPIKIGVQHLIDILNANSAYIITFAIILCAGGMMVAPMLNVPSGKWFSRLIFVFWIGVIWQVFII